MNHCPSGSSPEGFFSREFAALGEHSRRRRRIPGENMFSKTEKERRERVEDYLRRSMERHGESVYRLALCRLHHKQDVEFEVRTDPALLGGFTLEIEGMRYDKSVRGALAGLARQLEERRMA